MLKDIEKIADNFGLESQLIKLQEECSEVVQAICKMQIEGFTPERVKEFVGELADKALEIKRIVSLEEIIENDYTLSVNNYIQEEVEIKEVDVMELENQAREGVLKTIRSHLDFSQALCGLDGDISNIGSFLYNIVEVVNEFTDIKYRQIKE